MKENYLYTLRKTEIKRSIRHTNSVKLETGDYLLTSITNYGSFQAIVTEEEYFSNIVITLFKI